MQIRDIQNQVFINLKVILQVPRIITKLSIEKILLQIYIKDL